MANDETMRTPGWRTQRDTFTDSFGFRHSDL